MDGTSRLMVDFRRRFGDDTSLENNRQIMMAALERLIEMIVFLRNVNRPYSHDLLTANTFNAGDTLSIQCGYGLQRMQSAASIYLASPAFQLTFPSFREVFQTLLDRDQITPLEGPIDHAFDCATASLLTLSAKPHWIPNDLVEQLLQMTDTANFQWFANQPVGERNLFFETPIRLSPDFIRSSDPFAQAIRHASTGIGSNLENVVTDFSDGTADIELLGFEFGDEQGRTCPVVHPFFRRLFKTQGGTRQGIWLGRGFIDVNDRSAIRPLLMGLFAILQHEQWREPEDFPDVSDGKRRRILASQQFEQDWNSGRYRVRVIDLTAMNSRAPEQATDELALVNETEEQLQQTRRSVRPGRHVRGPFPQRHRVGPRATWTENDVVVHIHPSRVINPHLPPARTKTVYKLPTQLEDGTRFAVEGMRITVSGQIGLDLGDL